MPWTLMATPFSTVVNKEQVSGQSCGHAPRICIVLLVVCAELRLSAGAIEILMIGYAVLGEAGSSF